MGELFIVGPLGESCQDVPLRALRILRQAALIVVQDVGDAHQVLGRLGVQARVLAADEAGAREAILRTLAVGDVAWLIAQVAELSGPAHRLLVSLLEQGVVLASVPGASAAISGLAISGLSADRFTFLGLLPESPQVRRSLLQRVVGERWTVVCEVMIGHVPDVLGDVLALLGDRQVALYQDQDVWRGRASQAGAWPGTGRWVLVIERAESDQAWTTGHVRDEVHELLAAGMSPRDVAREVAQRSGWPKRKVYQMVLPGAQADAQADVQEVD
jgi:16S rRNA (cytidine1402-2'-O)-methyltransferase